MTTIRTTCPACGEVDMGPEDIHLSVRHEAGDGTYTFDCPGCRQEVQKEADPKIVALLVSAGVALEDGPRDPRDLRSGSSGGPALTLDDAIEFHFQLEDPHALESFLQGV